MDQNLTQFNDWLKKAFGNIAGIVNEVSDACKDKPCCGEKPCQEVPDLKEPVVENPSDLVYCKDNCELDGIIVFYVNVGQMPIIAAEKYVQRVKKCYDGICKRLPSKWAIMWVASRETATTVEVLRLN